MPKRETGKSGGKKIGRSMRSPSYARYNNEYRKAKNKARKLKKHIKQHPNDSVAVKAKGGL